MVDDLFATSVYKKHLAIVLLQSYVTFLMDTGANTGQFRRRKALLGAEVLAPKFNKNST